MAFEEIEERLFNVLGVPVGSYRSRRPLSKKEREWAAEFCDRLVQSFKSRSNNMGKSKDEKEIEYANYVALAGYVQSAKINEENAFLLVDVTGQDSGGAATKWVPVTCYKEPELLERLEHYGKGDAIKIRGYVRAWSQKKDGEWRNAVDIRITEIVSKDPERKTAAPSGATRKRDAGDDGWPF